MTKEERLKKIKESNKIYIDAPKKRVGGQQCGMPTYATIVENDVLDVKISIGFFKSNYKNRELALQIMDLVSSDLIK
jgi:hypothetical protein